MSDPRLAISDPRLAISDASQLEGFRFSGRENPNSRPDASHLEGFGFSGQENPKGFARNLAADTARDSVADGVADHVADAVTNTVTDAVRFLSRRAPQSGGAEVPSPTTGEVNPNECRASRDAGGSGVNAGGSGMNVGGSDVNVSRNPRVHPSPTAGEGVAALSLFHERDGESGDAVSLSHKENRESGDAVSLSRKGDGESGDSVLKAVTNATANGVLDTVTMICIPLRDTSPHRDSAGIAPSGTPPLAQPTPTPQTRGAQSHSAPTPLELLCTIGVDGNGPVQHDGRAARFEAVQNLHVGAAHQEFQAGWGSGLGHNNAGLCDGAPGGQIDSDSGGGVGREAVVLRHAAEALRRGQSDLALLLLEQRLELIGKR